MAISTIATTTNERYWGRDGVRNGNPKWTEELEVRLKELFDQGLSKSKIATALGFKTRNAIIGKLHRLGIVNVKPPTPREKSLSRNEQIAKTQHDQATLYKINQRRKHRYRVKLEEPLDLPAYAPVEPHAFDAAIPLEQRRTLVELSSYCCRWPIGDPGSKEFYFCGGPADLTSNQPYCKHHTKRAINKRDR